MTPSLPAGSSLQEAHYSEGVDYTHGSPHLADGRLRSMLSARVLHAIRDLHERGLPLRVLELGAGHGGYTEPALATGAEVTAVEMSRPALKVLEDRYGTNSNLKTMFSKDGKLDDLPGDYTLLLCVSVLHHIPDYLAALKDALSHMRPGGSVLTLQDPLWYPRLPTGVHMTDRGAYLAWRVRQGNLGRGLASFGRRATRRMNEQRAGDMVEYHVVRHGVDEAAIRDSLQASFGHVELIKYWSNQLPVAQTLGRRLGIENTFGVWARDYAGQVKSSSVETM